MCVNHSLPNKKDGNVVNYPYSKFQLPENYNISISHCVLSILMKSKLFLSNFMT